MFNSCGLVTAESVTATLPVTAPTWLGWKLTVKEHLFVIYLEGLCTSPCSEPFEVLDQDDDRIQQVSMAQGTLYSVLSTSVLTFGGKVPTSGVAWSSIKPTITGGSLSAQIKTQGYLAVQNGSLLYPAIAINTTGQGVIAFSMASDSMFPGLGYAAIVNGQVGSSIQVATVGLLPEDGFMATPCR